MDETFIRRRRRELGISVPQLVTKVGVSETSGWKWDRGLAVPRPENLGAIARALEVSQDELEANLPQSGHNIAGPAGPVDRILIDARVKLSKALRVPLSRIDINVVLRNDAPNPDD